MAPDKLRQIVIAHIKAGESKAAIARAMGIHINTVCKAWKAYQNRGTTNTAPSLAGRSPLLCPHKPAPLLSTMCAPGSMPTPMFPSGALPESLRCPWWPCIGWWRRTWAWSPSPWSKSNNLPLPSVSSGWNSTNWGKRKSLLMYIFWYWFQCLVVVPSFF